MDFASVLRIFRIMATEFAGLDDDTVLAWIELTAPLISKRRFGNLWAQALALLTAHRMKMANAGNVNGDDPLADVGEIGVGNLMRVGSYSEGEVSIGFNHNISQYTGANAELALTEYGIQYLSLRRMRIMPIVSAGEPNARS
jgi:hypothetical protein